MDEAEVVVARFARPAPRVGDVFLKADADQARTDAGLGVIRAWWSLRSLLGVRRPAEHGFDPFAPAVRSTYADPGCEAARARLRECVPGGTRPGRSPARSA